MSEPRIMFAKLRQFLLDLGFTETVVPDSHVAFLHSEFDADIMFPLHKPNQPVLPRHLVPVRTLLDARGLLQAEEFDRLLRSATVKQPGDLVSQHRDYGRCFNPDSALACCEQLLDDIEAARVALGDHPPEWIPRYARGGNGTWVYLNPPCDYFAVPSHAAVE